MKKRIFFLLISLICLKAWSQVDPVTSVLVNTASAPSAKQNLDSGRYTVKAAPPKPQPTADEIKKSIEEKIQQTKLKAEKAQSELAEKAKQPNPPAPEVPVTNKPENQDLTDKMSELFLGGDMESIQSYKNKLHAEDPRQNLIQISVAPSYLYIDSTSAYWYRNYSSSGPGLSVGTDIWFTPFLGLNVDYFTTLSANLKAEPGSSKEVLVDHRYLSAGFEFRKYNSLSRKSPNLVFGIDYAEYQLMVPRAEPYRAKIKSTGLALSVKANIPQTVNQSWFFGVELDPKMKFTEGKTSVSIKSGNSSNAYGFKFSFGEEFVFDRQSQVFWRLSHRVNKSVYEGTASPADPITGVAPKGVSVTESATLFEIGYTWGG